MNKKLASACLDLLDWGRIAGNILLGLTMVAVFAVGIVKIALASWLLVWTAFGAEDRAVAAITESLKGLEYFFLAPLGLLTFRALIRYVRVQITDLRQDKATVARMRADAERDVHQLKVLIGTLISAFLITDLVSRVVHSPSRTDFWYLAGELSVLAATILYVISLPQSRDVPGLPAGCESS